MLFKLEIFLNTSFFLGHDLFGLQSFSIIGRAKSGSRDQSNRANITCELSHEFILWKIMSVGNFCIIVFICDYFIGCILCKFIESASGRLCFYLICEWNKKWCCTFCFVRTFQVNSVFSTFSRRISTYRIFPSGQV